MKTCDARYIYFPYCLRRLDDGRYIVLNRQYKPIGSRTSDWVRYEDDPSAAAIKITVAAAKKLSWDGKDALDVIYLYNDGCIPTDSVEHWRAYSDRLNVFSKLAVQED